MGDGQMSAAGLAGKKVLVTGGAKRLGRGLALALADAGARVAITYLSSAEQAHASMRELERHGEEALTVRCDVREPASVRLAVESVVERFGGLDLLVNNAGLFATTALEAISVPEWDALFETNTRGPLLVAQSALPALRRARGRIVNIGSLGGVEPWATHAHYCSSKAALHMLSQTMAKAWAPEVSVNCVAPGMIAFDGDADAAAEQLAKRTPMRRKGRAEDVAAAVLFFAAAPHFITGQLLAVDGGLSL